MRPGRFFSFIASKRVWLWSAPLVWLGCGGGNTDVQLPALNVMTKTQGVELDPDGYQLAVDATPDQPIGSNDTVVVDQLADGDHSLRLDGLAANCSAGENPRTVTVRTGTTASEEFAVLCSATTGSLEIQVTVTGSGSDADGFVALLDGIDQGPIFPGPPAAFPHVAPGSHTVGLSGLAANCRVVGDNPVSIALAAGQDLVVPFTADCSPPPATSGTLQITTTTSGSDLDPDGYSIQVDAGTAQPIGDNGVVTLINLAAGQHTVRLLGLAGNCSAGGSNPAQVTVPAGGTGNVGFAVTCTPLGPTTGGIQVSVATTGSTLDADGYNVSVDGGSGPAIGVNGTRTITGLTPGSHSVQLANVAANCSVGGDNPQTIAVTAGQNTPATFAVTCTEPPAQTGGIRVKVGTTGSPVDPDGYAAKVDDASPQTIKDVNGSVTIAQLAPGPHSVLLEGVAPNCTVTGSNPVSLTVTAGQTVDATFAITCAATTGSIQVKASTTGGQPDPDGYNVAVDGTSRAITANGNLTFDGLQPGTHNVQLSGQAQNCTITSANPQSVPVTAGQTASVTFAVNCPAPGPSVNLKIERMYLTQSTQTPSGGVPLVQGRDAYLRVFVTASGANTIRPDVRVRIYRGGSLEPTSTDTISGHGEITPTEVQEGTFSSSWNLLVQGADIQPNTRVLADVDPTNAISEPNESDNNFPTTGTPQLLSVQSVPSASITFVPIKQVQNGLTGSVNNPTELMERARRMYPLHDIQTQSHEVFTTSMTTGVLQPFNDNHGWDSTLAELDRLRVAEGSSRTYFGMVKVTYGPGINGIGYVGTPTAVGSDDPAQVQRVVAHELGHTWGRWHSPCGNPGGLDPNHQYPYPNGSIGVFGLDVASQDVKLPSRPDIMSYCPNEWISDYTYQNVMSFRSSNQSVVTAGAVQSTLLVSGQIVNGRPLLDPSFHLTTRPTLPTRRGLYTVEGRGADGSRLFAISFDPAPIADGASDARHFAFAVPLDAARVAQLRDISLSGPGGQAAVTAPVRAAQVNPESLSGDISAQQGSDGVTLKWNAAAYPMIIVRDPDTGQVLSFARGGTGMVSTHKRQLDLEVSDGVRSQRVRLAISR